VNCTSFEKHPKGSLSQGIDTAKPYLQKNKLISLRSILDSDGLHRVGVKFLNTNLD